mmetsp:Transcript_618/g.1654  ORF Transcript_618/g.1654 Transcript_618/m.1654 type:complete len:231 (+) Transcript_618:292-984(+)
MSGCLPNEGSLSCRPPAPGKCPFVEATEERKLTEYSSFSDKESSNARRLDGTPSRASLTVDVTELGALCSVLLLCVYGCLIGGVAEISACISFSRAWKLTVPSVAESGNLGGATRVFLKKSRTAVDCCTASSKSSRCSPAERLGAIQYSLFCNSDMRHAWIFPHTTSTASSRLPLSADCKPPGRADAVICLSSAMEMLPLRSRSNTSNSRLSFCSIGASSSTQKSRRKQR